MKINENIIDKWWSFISTATLWNHQTQWDYCAQTARECVVAWRWASIDRGNLLREPWKTCKNEKSRHVPNSLLFNTSNQTINTWEQKTLIYLLYQHTRAQLHDRLQRIHWNKLDKIVHNYVDVRQAIAL